MAQPGARRDTVRGVQVRRARDDELEAIADVWHASRKAAHTEMGITAERGVDLAESRRAFREVIAARDEIWVAEEAGEILGFLAQRGSYLDRMYVLPERQRRGVGEALLAQARALSPQGLELHTHQKNRKARAFYEKHGFEAVRFGVSPPPENEPDVEYAWRPGRQPETG